MNKTKNQSYKNLKNKPQKRNIVLATIKKTKGATLFELVKALKWPVNCITGRVNELCKMGLVSDSGNLKKNPKTNRSAVIWVANV
jgi:predicted transcriptional regulator